MKYRFDNKQLEWLGFYAKQLARIANTQDEAMSRTVNKMKYKFTPNARLVFLGGKERDVLNGMLTYRLASLAEATVSGPEATAELELVQSILETVNAAH